MTLGHKLNLEYIESLASQILLYKKLYYTGKAAISDELYDSLEEELQKLDSKHPVLSQVGYIFKSENNKIRHEPPMLSLAKTYDENELKEFLLKYPCVASDKLDGMALALEYDGNGTLKNASTRGNGTLGEDVTEHVMHVLSIPKRLKLPLKMNEYTFEVRGEVFFPLSKFEPFSERFESYRNAIPGTFGRKEVEGAVDVLRVIRFCAYDFVVKRGGEAVLKSKEIFDLFEINQNSFLERLKLLEQLGFYSGFSDKSTLRVEKNDAENISQFLVSAFSRERDYAIDGLVFRIDDDILWENLGNTSHHPRGSIAFKQTGEVAITEIINIQQNVGRSGKISFRAQINPVFLAGATINYATLHNAEFVDAGGYAPGALVRIKRSGEVIPSIIGLEKPAPNKYELPEKCPCGYLLTRSGPDLFCYEKRPCPVKDQESLVYFVQTLDIMGVSDKIILKLRESGLVSQPADLFNLKIDDFLQLEGFAPKSAENAFNAIQLKRKLPLAVFLTSLGLKRGGAVKCAEVARKFESLEKVRKLCVDDLLSQKGWAQKSAEDFVTSLSEKAPIVDELLKYIEVESDFSEQLIAKNNDHPLFGKSVCITGELNRPREEYKILLEKAGAKLSSGVTSKTHLLVCNEASNSSKYLQAVKLNIEIINEAALASLLV